MISTLLLLLLLSGPAIPAPRSLSEARAAMMRGLRSSDPDERSRAVYELDGFDGDDAARALVRGVLSRDDDAQVVKAGLQLLGAMKSEGAAKALAQEAERGSWFCRARVLEALGKWRRAEAEAPLLRAAYDEDPRVRVSALLALEGIPGGRADLALSDAVSAEEWPVRSAAIHVLRQRKAAAGVSALIDRLEDERETGRLLDDVRDALVRITGEDFGFNPSRWRIWHDKQMGKTPPEQELPKHPPPEPRARLSRVETRASRVAYLLSINESMQKEVGIDGAARAPADVIKTGGEELTRWKEAKTKMDLARLWLDWSIRRLSPDTRFEVVTYGASANSVFSGLVPATPANQKKALTRVLALSPSGTSDLYAGLRHLFTIVSRDPLGLEDFLGGPEAVFVLADGTVDDGEYPDGFRACEQAERWNRYRQIRFFAFGIGAHDTRVISCLGSLGPGGFVGSLP